MGKTKTKSRSVGDSPKPPITIRSTNVKILDDNIAKLEKAIQASDVSANPSGTAEETLLSTIGIDGKKYELGPSAENTSYDNTDSGLTATDTQGAIDEIAEGIKEDFLVITTALPSDVSSLELNSNLELFVDEDLTGYGFVAMYAVTYDHINQINSRYLEYPIAYDTTEQKWEVVCQVLTKVFSSVYNSATVYILFKKII